MKESLTFGNEDWRGRRRKKKKKKRKKEKKKKKKNIQSFDPSLPLSLSPLSFLCVVPVLFLFFQFLF